MARALKVFRTAVGFHDAYVAAPTKKSALEAWGSNRNLFASGRAEIVTDPKLMEMPLASPGQVVKVLRGTDAEQIAALNQSKPCTKLPRPAEIKSTRRKPIPKPSRSALDRAERALTAATENHEKALAALDQREKEIRQQRREQEQTRDKEIMSLDRKRKRALEAYETAIARWRG